MTKFWFVLSILSLSFWPLQLVRADEQLSVNVQSKFERAMQLREDGDLFAAIDIFNEILTIKPSLQRVRLELATAYYRAAEFDQADELMGEIAIDPTISANVKKAVNLFIKKIALTKQENAKHRHHWSGDVGISIGSDDNMNIGPNENEFIVRGTKLTLSDDSQPKEDFMISWVANLNHNYRIPGSFRIGTRPVTALWQSAVNVTQHGYIEHSNKQLNVFEGTTGLSLLSQNSWRSNLNLQLSKFSFSGDSLASFAGINAAWIYNNQTSSEYTLRSQIMYRDYNRQSDKDKNGYRTSVGGDFSYMLANKVVLKTGVTLQKQDAKVSRRKSKSIDGYSSVLIPVFKKSHFFSQVNYQATNYGGEVAIFNKQRKDRQKRYTLGLTHKVNNKLQLRAGYSYTTNDSSVPSYDFSRNQVNVNLSKRF